jgi:hypothetical protein
MADTDGAVAQIRERLRKPLLWGVGVCGTIVIGGLTTLFTDAAKSVLTSMGTTACGFIHVQCGATDNAAKRFKVIPYEGKGITFDPDNGKYAVLLFYQTGREEDAGRIIGALQLAGYKTEWSLTDLAGVPAPDKSFGTTLIKTTVAARPKADDVLRIVRYAVRARPESSSSVYANDYPKFQRPSDLQIDLF